MENEKINSDDAALYDRQIRVWGFQAQQKIKDSVIGVVGTTGLGIELMKNVVLAGIGKLIIFDDKEVELNNIGSNFYLISEDVSKKRAEVCASKLKLLNSKVKIETCDVLDESNIKCLNVLCHIDDNLNEMQRINTLCRKLNIKYVSANTFGMYGYIIFDLLEHKYIIENKQEGTIENKIILYKPLEQVLSATLNGSKKQIIRKYSSSLFLIQTLHNFITKLNRKPKVEDNNDFGMLKNLSKLLANNIFKVDANSAIQIYDTLVNETILKQCISMCQGELSPCTAILGGTLAQEIIKVVSGKEVPINNVFVYNGLQDQGLVHTIS